LWTKGARGSLITVYNAFNEYEEARYIAEQISKQRQQGRALKEIAVFYRANMQSRVLEEQLMQNGIPYRIYGGQRFFDRAEIRDVVAYLRLLVNATDDMAWERVVNVPARGIGEATLILIRNHAMQQQLSLWRAAEELIAQMRLSERAAKMVKGFLALIRELQSLVKAVTLPELVKQVLQKSGLKANLERDCSEIGRLRLENLDELITATHRFIASDSSASLTTFLDVIALESGTDTPTAEDSVSLMTLHAAKGLEFPWVFICGMEEGLFPHIFSLERSANLEEERRLCYVGMTRAMQKLYLTYAENRRLCGVQSLRRPSRFLTELPEELVERATLLQTDAVSKSQCTSKPNYFVRGQKIKHEVFGIGTIMSTEGEGEFFYVKVQFPCFGTKLLSPSSVPLELI